MTQFNTDSRSVSQLNLLLFNKWTLQNGEIWVEAASEGQKCSETGTGSDSLVLWGCRSNHNPKIISDGAAHLQHSTTQKHKVTNYWGRAGRLKRQNSGQQLQLPDCTAGGSVQSNHFRFLRTWTGESKTC